MTDWVASRCKKVGSGTPRRRSGSDGAGGMVRAAPLSRDGGRGQQRGGGGGGVGGVGGGTLAFAASADVTPREGAVGPQPGGGWGRPMVASRPLPATARRQRRLRPAGWLRQGRGRGRRRRRGGRRRRRLGGGEARRRRRRGGALLRSGAAAAAPRRRPALRGGRGRAPCAPAAAALHCAAARPRLRRRQRLSTAALGFSSSSRDRR